ncbi:MAG: (4Fe-4S)-binding protein [Flavobacteriales bacterium]|nr:(4Fe-4S)-binding protein [Flavobacteriales bacterium]
MSKERTYTNGEVTIIWKPDLCIHSRKCWIELGAVFQPGKRPWIRADGASTEAIVSQVKQCPSGALSYRMDARTEEPLATGAIACVEVQADGPLLVRDACSVLHRDGRTEERARTTAFCRCGASANKPYCDGSHRRIGFTDREPQMQ